MTNTPSAPFVVCALYKFTPLPEFTELREPLLAQMQAYDVRGTLLLAHEGINGTIAGPQQGIDQVLNWLKQQDAFAELEYKTSLSEHLPFKRSKVKLKKEIVTMGIEGIDPLKSFGTYIEAEDWNDLISDPEVTLIDCRNDYEYQVGTFKGAINPNTDTFREFPDYIKETLDPAKNKKVAMFCTGGIRCEKSTAYLKEQGFEEVYHLKGGVLKYFEDVATDDTLWEGECFVFDDRVTVDQELQPGSYDQCHACRLPITEADKQSEKYQLGVSCPHCYDQVDEAKRERFAQRQKQIELAKARGEEHIGGEAHYVLAERRKAKKAAIRAQQEARLAQAQPEKS
ncbi:MAG: rhodanese-related sulfurtransferase [Pseudomonadota bacterium]|nr:rhodanese-related sulfurtransferase [Pseudomonadota bacterium]